MHTRCNKQLLSLLWLLTTTATTQRDTRVGTYFDPRRISVGVAVFASPPLAFCARHHHITNNHEGIRRVIERTGCGLRRA